MCRISFGSGSSKASGWQEPSTLAPRPLSSGLPLRPLSSHSHKNPSSQLPSGTAVQTVAPRGSSDGRGSRRSVGYYVDDSGQRRNFAVVETADGRRKRYILDAAGNRGSASQVEADGKRRSYIVAADGRRLSVVELEGGSGARLSSGGLIPLSPTATGPESPANRRRSRRSSQVVVIDQAPRTPRASGTLGSPRASGTLRSPRASGALGSPATSPRLAQGLGLGELDFPPDAAAGSLKVVRRASSRSPRTSGASLNRRASPDRGVSGNGGGSGGGAQDGSSSATPRRGSFSRRRPSFTRQRLSSGDYELRSGAGEVVRIETAGPGSPRIAPLSPRLSNSRHVGWDGGVGMARVRSEGGAALPPVTTTTATATRRLGAGMGSPGLAGGPGAYGMTRSVSSGGGAAMMRTASGGVGMARTTSGGVGMARTPSGGVGTARTTSGGVGMARTPSGDIAMARTASSGGVVPARTTSSGGSVVTARVASGGTTTTTPSRTTSRASAHRRATSGSAVPTLRTPSDGAPLAKTASASGSSASRATRTGGLAASSSLVGGGSAGTAMGRTRSASAAAAAADPRASATSVKTNGSRRDRERIVVVDERGVRREYYR